MLVSDGELEHLPTTPTVPVMVFEGAVVSKHEGRIPALTLDMADGYPRGSTLTLQIEVRVRGVRMDEDKHGDLTRHHVFALEEVALISSKTPTQAAEDSRVGGSASQSEADEQQPVDDEAEMGDEMDDEMDQWLQGDGTNG